MATFDWDAANNAIYTWIETITGLAATNILWENQNNVRPTGPFITMSWQGPLAIGHDYVYTNYDSGRDLGEEIELRVHGNRRLILTIQYFAGDATGNSSPIALLSQLKTSIRLPSINTTLNDAGLYPHSFDNISNIPAIVGQAFEARTLAEISFHMAEEVSEYTGYITTVSGVATVATASGVDVTIPYLSPGNLDFNSIFPSSPELLQSVMGAGAGSASYIWQPRQPSSNQVDLVAGQELLATGTGITYIAPADEIAAGELGIQHANASNGAHRHADPSFFVPGTDSFAILHVAYIDSTTTSTRICNKLNSLNGYYIDLSISGETISVRALIGDNASNFKTRVLSFDHGGAYYSILLVVDKNAGTMELSTALASSSTTIPAVGFIGESAVSTYSIGASTSVTGAKQTWVYHAVWEGTEAEGMSASNRANFDTYIGLPAAVDET